MLVFKMKLSDTKGSEILDQISMNSQKDNEIGKQI